MRMEGGPCEDGGKITKDRGRTLREWREDPVRTERRAHEDGGRTT